MEIAIGAAKIKDFLKEVVMNNFTPTNLKTYKMNKFLKTMLLKLVKEKKKKQ